MGPLFVWSTVIGLVLVAIVAALPWLLKKRGVTMCQTKFGTTLIFESENADGTPAHIETESTGGITFDTMIPYAKAGVDFISFGALTHSVKALDMSLKAKGSSKLSM